MKIFLARRSCIGLNRVVMKAFLPKFAVFGLFLVCLAVFSAGAGAAEGRKLKVVTSFTVIADIARNVAGDRADVESITKPGAEIHDYQPTPKDIVRAQGAGLVLWNGLNLERWFERFMKDVGNVPGAVVSEGVVPESIYEGPYTGKPNPHAWMSSANALVYVENIRKALSAADPANAEAYAANAAAYAAKIEQVRNRLAGMLASIPEERRYLVTSEGAFSYLARDLGMKEVYLWPINADQQGTPQQIRKVIDTMREKRIPVVFSESTVSDSPAKEVAAETGALYGGVLYVDSLSGPEGPVPSYLDLLEVTVGTVAEGFRGALEAEEKGEKGK